MTHQQLLHEARMDERQRILTILNSPEAQGREKQARHLALATDVPAAEAIKIMSSAPVSGALDRRMNGQTPGIGAEHGLSPTSVYASRKAAVKDARGGDGPGNRPESASKSELPSASQVYASRRKVD